MRENTLNTVNTSVGEAAQVSGSLFNTHNTLLLHKFEKNKVTGTSREISSAMDENHNEY